MHYFALLAFCAMLAGRALALNITVGTSLINIPASQFLSVNDNTLDQNCQSQCGPALSAIKTCTDTNDQCLCSNATVTAITVCEQCMFADLIRRNQPAPDPRAGTTPALQAYATACNASLGVTVPASLITLTIPDGWTGPLGVGLNLGATVVTVIIGAILGAGAITVVSTM